jgi:ribosome biogenesis GTPase
MPYKGGYIADTPGFSTYEMQDISCNELDKLFIEFIPYISKCEFRGCSHIKERKCAVRQAAEDGKIDFGRYARYCKFYDDIKENKKW